MLLDIFSAQVVAEPCDAAGTATATIFDASFSSDPSGRELQQLEWAQESATVMNPVLSEAINAANLCAKFTDKSTLRLTPAAVAQLTDGAYTLTVKVTSFLGSSSTANHVFRKVARGTYTPVVSIIKGPVQSFRIADGVKLDATVEPSSVCAGQTVSCTYCFWHCQFS